PQDRLDPGHQLARIERLGQIVVGPKLQSDDLIDVVVAGGDHDDWEIAVSTQVPADLPAVELRQHQVEHYQVRPGRLHFVECLATIRSGLDLEPFLLEVDPGELHDIALVVDDQDRPGHAQPSP